MAFQFFFDREYRTQKMWFQMRQMLEFPFAFNTNLTQNKRWKKGNQSQDRVEVIDTQSAGKLFDKSEPDDDTKCLLKKVKRERKG